ncbi:hypothetical protein KI387_015423, partial [Taxus chinensis]
VRTRLMTVTFPFWSLISFCIPIGMTIAPLGTIASLSTIKATRWCHLLLSYTAVQVRTGEAEVLLKIRNTEEELERWPGWKQVIWELQNQKSIGLPIAAMNMMWFGRIVISIAFLGRLREFQLAGGALVLTFANVTAFLVQAGLSDGMEPLCAQAFGATDHELLDTTLYRGVLVLLLGALPIRFLWLNVESLLLKLGQDKETSYYWIWWPGSIWFFCYWIWWRPLF